MKILLIILCILAVLVFLGWLGLQIKPKAFSAYPEKAPALETVPLPAGLPAPVERFYNTVYGDEIPVIESVVIKGRAFISPFGVKFPARFLFVHNAGKDYRHYIEATWFGIPFMKVNESFVDGKSLFERPIGTFYNDASIAQGADLALWAEAAWFPAIFLTDPRVHWEPVDDKTALFFVPFGKQEENFVVRFDPETGLIDSWRQCAVVMPVRKAKRFCGSPEKYHQAILLAATRAVGYATWLDQGKPWATFTLEEVNYNVKVSEYIRQKGPITGFISLIKRTCCTGSV